MKFLIIFLLFPCIVRATEIADNTQNVIQAIQDYYIQSTNSSEIGKNILLQLEHIDKNTKITAKQKEFFISYNGLLVYRFPEPQTPRDWGKYIEKSYKILKNKSYIFSAMNHKLFLENIINNMLKSLDSYSYYSYSDTDKAAHYKEKAKVIYPQIMITSANYRKENSSTNISKSGYLTIKIKNFNNYSAMQVKQSISDYSRRAGSRFKGIILDLRNSSGGSLLEAIEIADLFLDRVKIASVKGRHSASFQEYYGQDGQIAFGVPIAVLVNSATASSAELLSAALQENKRAKIIGEQSYGKSTVQTKINISPSSELVLTWARFLTPHGKDIQNTGLYIDKTLYSSKYHN